jgi:amidohydrolase
LNDFMASNPELGGQEYLASKKMAAMLGELGFRVEFPFADIPTAFRGVMGKEDAPVVALMVEYDALPELGHACGHCLHGSMSILAAAGLASVMSELYGCLWVIGTPAEETKGAKVQMAEEGVFDGVTLAMMIHSHSKDSFVRYRALALEPIKFTFRGKTAHAAGAPWDGLNALNGLQLFFHAIDMLRQHVKPDVRIHGIVISGGTAPNIVPEEAKGLFYFRSEERSYLDKVVQKAFDCARGAALATGTEVSWEIFETPFDNMVPNEPAETMMEEVYEELGIPLSESRGPLGSSDVGNVSHVCPAIQPVLAITEEDIAGHTRDFAAAVTTPFGYEALHNGARALARAALKTFLDPELQRRMKEARSDH